MIFDSLCQKSQVNTNTNLYSGNITSSHCESTVHSSNNANWYYRISPAGGSRVLRRDEQKPVHLRLRPGKTSHSLSSDLESVPLSIRSRRSTTTPTSSVWRYPEPLLASGTRRKSHLAELELPNRVPGPASVFQSIALGLDVYRVEGARKSTWSFLE